MAGFSGIRHRVRSFAGGGHSFHNWSGWFSGSIRIPGTGRYGDRQVADTVRIGPASGGTAIAEVSAAFVRLVNLIRFGGVDRAACAHNTREPNIIHTR